MPAAFKTFPDGGRIYKDNAGRLTAYIFAGGAPQRQRVRTEVEGEKWIAATFCAHNPDFLPHLQPEMRTVSLRMKWKKQNELERTKDRKKRKELEETIKFLSTTGLSEENHAIVAELEGEETAVRMETRHLAALSLAQMKDALDALNLLGENAPGTSLVEAVRSFIASGAGSPTVADAVRAFLKQKTGSAATLRNYGVQARRLCKAFPNKRIDDLDPLLVEDLAQKNETSAFRPFVAQLSTFALNNGWIKEALVERAAHPKAESKPRTILSVEEVERLLIFTATRESGILLPVVLQLFCGLRLTGALSCVEGFLEAPSQGLHYPPALYGAEALHAWFDFIRRNVPKTLKDKFQVSRKTRLIFDACKIGQNEKEVLRHTGNAYKWYKACAEGRPGDATQSIHLTPKVCLSYYGEPNEGNVRGADRFFAITPAILQPSAKAVVK